MSSDFVPPNTADEDGRNSVRLAVGLLAVLAIVVMVYYATKPANRKRGEVSSGLMKNGWILYTRPGCGFCDQQKSLLGNKFLNSAGNVIDCSTQNMPNPPLKTPGTSTPQCGDPRIVGYPFWYSNQTGGIKIGLQDADQLRRMAASRSS
jgi:hypothetical protein